MLWIVDMVIDRLFFLFHQKSKNVGVFRDMGPPVNGYVEIHGRSVFVGSKLPGVYTPLLTLPAEDVGTEVLDRLVYGMRNLNEDFPVLRFVADVVKGLGAEIEETWLAATDPKVRDIFHKSSHQYLKLVTRDDFCARYHHHCSLVKFCYTQHSAHAGEYFDALYATESSQELVKLSDGLPMANNLANIVYSMEGDASKLRRDNSSAEILHAEKMVLGMECRLEEAKGALWRAHEADEGKVNSIREAARIVQKLSGAGWI